MRSSATTFGNPLADKQSIQDWIADSRIEIDEARLLTMQAAWMMDTVGNRQPREEISAIKVVVRNVACSVIDRAIQVHGGGGVSDDFPLAMYAHPHAAHRRRPRRGAQAHDRPARAASLGARRHDVDNHRPP